MTPDELRRMAGLIMIKSAQATSEEYDMMQKAARLLTILADQGGILIATPSMIKR